MLVEKIKSKIRGTMDINRLKKDGFKFGKNFNAQYGVIIDPGHCWLIEVGDNVTLAPRVHILAHDASMKRLLGYTKIGRVRIGNNVFLGAGTIVLPNVKIGDNVIVGSGSVITKDLPSNAVYAGNPCKKIYDINEWLDKQEILLKTKKNYDDSYIIGKITESKKEEMIVDLIDDIGFII